MLILSIIPPLLFFPLLFFPLSFLLYLRGSAGRLTRRTAAADTRRTHDLRYVLKNKDTGDVFFVVVFTLVLKEDVEKAEQEEEEKAKKEKSRDSEASMQGASGPNDDDDDDDDVD